MHYLIFPTAITVHIYFNCSVSHSFLLCSMELIKRILALVGRQRRANKYFQPVTMLHRVKGVLAFDNLQGER